MVGTEAHTTLNENIAWMPPLKQGKTKSYFSAVERVAIAIGWLKVMCN